MGKERESEREEGLEGLLFFLFPKIHSLASLLTLTLVSLFFPSCRDLSSGSASLTPEAETAATTTPPVSVPASSSHADDARSVNSSGEAITKGGGADGEGRGGASSKRLGEEELESASSAVVRQELTELRHLLRAYHAGRFRYSPHGGGSGGNGGRARAAAAAGAHAQGQRAHAHSTVHRHSPAASSASSSSAAARNNSNSHATAQGDSGISQARLGSGQSPQQGKPAPGTDAHNHNRNNNPVTVSQEMEGVVGTEAELVAARSQWNEAHKKWVARMRAVGAEASAKCGSACVQSEVCIRVLLVCVLFFFGCASLFGRLPTATKSVDGCGE